MAERLALRYIQMTEARGSFYSFYDLFSSHTKHGAEGIVKLDKTPFELVSINYETVEEYQSSRDHDQRLYNLIQGARKGKTTAPAASSSGPMGSVAARAFSSAALFGGPKAEEQKSEKKTTGFAAHLTKASEVDAKVASGMADLKDVDADSLDFSFSGSATPRGLTSKEDETAKTPTITRSKTVQLAL